MDRPRQRRFNKLSKCVKQDTDDLEVEPVLSTDKSTLQFVLSLRGRDVTCSLAVDALVQCFWLPDGAAEEQIYRTFKNGLVRIVATAQRKWLARGGKSVLLNAQDFEVHR
jgi:hypothetical protein